MTSELGDTVCASRSTPIEHAEPHAGPGDKVFFDRRVTLKEFAGCSTVALNSPSSLANTAYTYAEQLPNVTIFFY
jgi:hypothetical protein